jgi:putative tryptophan/tyrosine transport system substrate-binding protein
MWGGAVGCMVVLTLSLCAVPLAANAQPAGQMPRIGFLAPNVSPGPTGLEAFQQGLRDHGYVEGQHLAIEAPNLEPDQFDQLPSLAAGLVRLGVSLIVAAGPEAVLRAAREATSTIPS